LNKPDAWTCLYNDIQQTDVHIYSESSSDDDDEGRISLFVFDEFNLFNSDANMDDDDNSSSSSSDDESIEIEAPDSIPNETPDDYYNRTREFWFGEARKELKITDTSDDSVRVQHLAKQMSKLFFQS